MSSPSPKTHLGPFGVTLQHQKNAEAEAIRQHIEAFLANGGQIEVLGPNNASLTPYVKPKGDAALKSKKKPPTPLAE